MGMFSSRSNVDWPYGLLLLALIVSAAFFGFSLCLSLEPRPEAESLPYIQGYYSLSPLGDPMRVIPLSPPALRSPSIQPEDELDSFPLVLKAVEPETKW